MINKASNTRGINTEFLMLPGLVIAFVIVMAMLLNGVYQVKSLIILEEEQLSIWNEIRINQIRIGRRNEAPDPEYLLEQIKTETFPLIEREHIVGEGIRRIAASMKLRMRLLGYAPEINEQIVEADVNPTIRKLSVSLLDNSEYTGDDKFSNWFTETFNLVQSRNLFNQLEVRNRITHNIGQRLIIVGLGMLFFLFVSIIASFWLLWKRKMTHAFEELNAANASLKQQNIELRRVESQSRIAQQTAKFGYWVMNRSGTIMCSDGLLHILGLSADQAAPYTLEQLAEYSPSSEREKLLNFYTTTMNNRESAETVRTLMRQDGKTLYLRECIEIPHAVSPPGELAVFGILLDITARREAETRLVHAQKMEAVGQLTGGIAHDFNNLLAVITGNAELIKMSPTGDSSRHASTIINTVDRGRRLVDQLLLFSSRSSLSPEVLYLSDVLAGMSELVPRSLTEQVELKFDVQEDLWPMFVDRATFENSLLNLIINASSAIDESGIIEIAARNVSKQYEEPGTRGDVKGDYVRIEIRDNGRGMTEEVARRAFEPFFTTRGKGGGNGLGLSMVYGFVKSSRGSITIDSKPKEGATIRICLPRSMESIRLANKPSLSVPKGNGETVLVVEDQLELLDIVSAQLESLGYETCQAENAPAAEELLRAEPSIDLMLTDIKLPLGISGIQLAESAIKIRPDLKILFTTGYADIDFKQTESLASDYKILRKPIGYQAMAEGVRQALVA